MHITDDKKSLIVGKKQIYSIKDIIIDFFVFKSLRTIKIYRGIVNGIIKKDSSLKRKI